MLGYICCLIIACLWKADTVSLIVWIVPLGVYCFVLQELFEVWGFFYLHQIEHLFPICLESKYGYPHNAQDPIIKARAMRHCLFLNAMYAITLFIDYFFVSNICSDSFRNFSVWNGKIVFFRRLYRWLSFCLQHNPSSISLHVFPSSRALVLKHHSAI